MSAKSSSEPRKRHMLKAYPVREPQIADRTTAGMVMVRLLARPEAMPPELTRGGWSESEKASRLGWVGRAQMLEVLTSSNDFRLPDTTT